MVEMHGAYLGSRIIRCNWASQKGSQTALVNEGVYIYKQKKKFFKIFFFRAGSILRLFTIKRLWRIQLFILEM
jgi:hypothetical protein